VEDLITTVWKLQADIKATRANQEKMTAQINVNLENIEANMEAYLEKTEANEEMLEANQEKIETMAEHNKWVSCIRATHLLTILQGLDSYVLHGVSKGVTYEEIIGALED
jgi:hypothetical protein